MKIEQVLIAIDQLLNAFCNGMADETLSSRAHRRQHKNRFWKHARKYIDLFFLLFFFQKNHCYQSYLSEVKRKHVPPDFHE